MKFSRREEKKGPICRSCVLGKDGSPSESLTTTSTTSLHIIHTTPTPAQPINWPSTARPVVASPHTESLTPPNSHPLSTPPAPGCCAPPSCELRARPPPSWRPALPPAPHWLHANTSSPARRMQSPTLHSPTSSSDGRVCLHRSKPTSGWR